MNPVVQGVRFADHDDLEGQVPGSFQFVSCVKTGCNPDNLPVNTLPDHAYHIGGLIWICPGGCGRESTILFRGRCDRGDGHAWDWNGSEEKPTLNPSILSMACKWHGYLVDGVWRPVDDSACPGPAA